MAAPKTLGIIAGNGVYPRLLADAARRAGVKRIVAAAFLAETDERLAGKVDEIHWMRVGQLAKLIGCFRNAGVANAIMAGQIAPKNLFDLRPDWKMLLLLARLKRRNAESIFAAIGDELARAGVTLLPATSFLEDCLATAGLIAGSRLTHREEDDVTFGERNIDDGWPLRHVVSIEQPRRQQLTLIRKAQNHARSQRRRNYGQRISHLLVGNRSRLPRLRRTSRRHVEPRIERNSSLRHIELVGGATAGRAR